MDLNNVRGFVGYFRHLIHGDTITEIPFPIKTKSRYVILHGWKSSPEQCWLPWLKKELESLGYEVIAPKMPFTFFPNVANQVNYVLSQIKFDQNTILIGHSLGTVVSMRILERLETPIKKLVLVSGLMEPKFADKPRLIAKILINWKFNFDKIKKNVQKIIILRDVNDTLIAPEEGGRLHGKLAGQLIEFQAEKPHTCGNIEPIVLENALDFLRVKTSRADALFGVTFIAVATDHPILEDFKDYIENIREIEEYKSTPRGESVQEDLSGIKIKGIEIFNPINKEKIPIFVARHVSADDKIDLGIPAHDERDLAFAHKHNLPVRPVIVPNIANLSKESIKIEKEELVKDIYTDEGILIDSGPFSGLSSDTARKAIARAVRGKVINN